MHHPRLAASARAPRLVLLAALAAALIGACTSGPAATATATPATTATVVATPTIATSASPTPSSAPPSASPATSCLTSLVARVVSWDSGAGSHFATVELKNGGATACDVPELSPELVDATDKVLIAATPSVSAIAVNIAAGAVVHSVVRVANVCDPSYTNPVTVAFLGTGVSLRATPAASSGDAVPPCLGDPGSAGHIEIQPWQGGPA